MMRYLTRPRFNWIDLFVESRRLSRPGNCRVLRRRLVECGVRVLLLEP